MVNGVETRPPKYYDKLLKRTDRQLHDQTKEEREFTGYKQRSDNTRARLAVKEEVKIAALNNLKRKL